VIGLFKPPTDGSGLPSGINGLPLETARIQIPNQNGLYKLFPAANHGFFYFYCSALNKNRYGFNENR
jgi:hypothetical protein